MVIERDEDAVKEVNLEQYLRLTWVETRPLYC